MASNSKSKSISKKGLMQWDEELRDNYEFESDCTGEKIIQAFCKVCKKHCTKVLDSYKGKIGNDVITYGKNGTTHLLKPNLVRHLNSDGHRKCMELETGQHICKKQKTISESFSSARGLAKEALRPLLCASVYLGRKEKPYSQYPDFLETCEEMGLQTTTAFRNPHSAKVFNHIVAEQMVDNLRQTISETNFYSWLIDGSAAAKRRLTYESELIFIRTAKHLIPKVELFRFVPMQNYATVDSNNLFHALLKELCTLGDKELEKTNIYTQPVDEVSSDAIKSIFMERGFHKKIVGAAADGAATNFGCKKGLVTVFKSTVAEWAVTVHCLSHRLELAASDALHSLFGDIDSFLKEIYLHFRNSQKEWCLVLKLGAQMNIAVLTQPKAHGTRFLPHLKHALNALHYNWLIYIFHFGNIKESSKDAVLSAKVSAWLQKLLDFNFLVRCRVYEDLILQMSTTANLFQSDDARSMADSIRAYRALHTERELLVDNPGECESDLWQRVDKGVPAAPADIVYVKASTRSGAPRPSTENSLKIKLNVKIERHGEKDPSNPKSRSHFMNVEFDEPVTLTNMQTQDGVAKLRRMALDKLDTALKDRYSELDNSAHVLSKIKFIDTTLWPDDPKELVKFGVDDVKNLCQHFRVPLLNANIGSEIEILQEFKAIKLYYGPQLSAREIKKKPKEFWAWVYNIDGAKYNNFFLLVELILCIPFSTAVVERGFSSIRRILTDWRATLGTALISDCLHFSTRREQLNEKSVRDELINSACDSFLVGSEKENDVDGLGTLTKRRINKLLKGIELKSHIDDSTDLEDASVSSKMSQDNVIIEQTDTESSDEENSDSDST